MLEFNSMPTVTICSLVRNRDWILNHFLTRLYEIDYPKSLINILYIVNNSSDNSENILREFKKKYDSEYNEIEIIVKNSPKLPEDYRLNTVRVNHIYQHLADLRNFALQQARTEKFLFIDSDILVTSNLLNNLIAQKKEVISSLIWNGYELFPDQPWKYPNIMKIKTDYIDNHRPVYEHISNYYIKNSPNLNEDKVIKVDLTGAVMLIDKTVYPFAKFKFSENGEDSGFCEDVKKMGYDIWCNVGLFSQHVMTKEQLINLKL